MRRESRGPAPQYRARVYTLTRILTLALSLTLS